MWPEFLDYPGQGDGPAVVLAEAGVLAPYVLEEGIDSLFESIFPVILVVGKHIHQSELVGCFGEVADGILAHPCFDDGAAPAAVYDADRHFEFPGKLVPKIPSCCREIVKGLDGRLRPAAELRFEEVSLDHACSPGNLEQADLGKSCGFVDSVLACAKSYPVE